MSKTFLTLMSAVMICFLFLMAIASCAPAEGSVTYLPSMPFDSSGIPGVTVELRALYDRNNQFIGYRIDDMERNVVCYTVTTSSISCVAK